jgi:hypothetical protein
LKKSLSRNYKKVIDEALDIIVKKDVRGNIVGFEILLTYGSPNIWITENGIYGASWGHKEFIPISISYV